jgi:isopentenyl diphosphate isomerase/L-lactate dehydrogenase-like FMN-dependent dehydrogenase
MSGFEVAGIVLATLPLIINALEHYAKGVETVARWRKYAAGITFLILTVKTQRIIFTNTLEQLLTGIVRADDMMDVLKDAGGEAWRTADIHNQLKDRLRDAYSAYVGNVEEMHKALKAMMENLALDPSGQVCTIWVVDC